MEGVGESVPATDVKIENDGGRWVGGWRRPWSCGRCRGRRCPARGVGIVAATAAVEGDLVAEEANLDMKAVVETAVEEVMTAEGAAVEKAMPDAVAVKAVAELAVPDQSVAEQSVVEQVVAEQEVADEEAVSSCCHDKKKRRLEEHEDIHQYEVPYRCPYHPSKPKGGLLVNLMQHVRDLAAECKDAREKAEHVAVLQVLHEADLT